MKIINSLLLVMTLIPLVGHSLSNAETNDEAIPDDDRRQTFFVWKLPVGVEDSYLISIDEKNQVLNTGESACFYPTDPSTMFLFRGMTKSRRFCLILLKDDKIISTRVILLEDKYRDSFDWPQLNEIKLTEKEARDAIRIAKKDAEERGSDQPAYAPESKPAVEEKKPKSDMATPRTTSDQF